MNKTFKFYSIVWVICFCLFNIIVFLTPNIAKFSGAFWIGYIFIILAFIGHIISVYFALKDNDSKRIFYNIPIVLISYIGILAVLVVGTVTMAVPGFPIWLGIILCFAALSFMVISVITATSAGTIVSETDGRLRTSAFTIRLLSAEAEHLMIEAKTIDIKAEAKKVYESIRYSDPVSNVALYEINERIQKRFSAFSDAVKSDDLELTKAVGAELISLVDERSKKCKLLK